MIQRDGPLTLNTPSLGQPADPAAKYGKSDQYKLHLDPAVQALLWQRIDVELDPARVRPELGKVSYLGPGLPKPPGAQAAPAPGASLTPSSSGAPAGSSATPAVNPFTLPAIPDPLPPVPKGAGPDAPKAAGAGDIAEAVAAVPAVDQALTGLKDQAKAKVLTDWNRLSTGEKAITVSSVVMIGAGALAGIASDPEARKLALGQLNGKVLPVPKVPWMRLEVNTASDNLMIGIHVDVGTLLPPSLGFGPGSSSAIGGPPDAAQRVPAGDAVDAPGGTGGGAASGIGRRIQAMAGQGAPMPTAIGARFSQELGRDLSGVRLHTGHDADGLSRDLNARAFTSGPDIFFRAGAFDPTSMAGRRLLAHEACHTVQQATGPVDGRPVSDDLRVSDPQDRFEQEATRLSERLARQP